MLANICKARFRCDNENNVVLTCLGCSIVDVISKYEKLPIADGIVEEVDFAHENVCIYLKKA